MQKDAAASSCCWVQRGMGVGVAGEGWDPAPPPGERAVSVNKQLRLREGSTEPELE